MRADLLFVPALLLLGAGPAFSNTIDQSQSVGLTNVGDSFSVPVEFSEFDPALGALTSVTLSLKASFSGTVGIENLSASPDVASGIIAGSVTVSTTGGSISVEVFPSAPGPVHDLTAFDGTRDYAGTSGATDSVSGADASASTVAPPPTSALDLFTGDQQLFLTLTASTFPIVSGLETESVTETANAKATVELTYAYAPTTSVPEPKTIVLTAIGVAFLVGSGWRRGSGVGKLA
jgi:hypothetical protein